MSLSRVFTEVDIVNAAEIGIVENFEKLMWNVKEMLKNITFKSTEDSNKK